VLGSVDGLVDEAAARQAVSALRIYINAGDVFKANATTFPSSRSTTGGAS
jgi:hypothetical protein